VFAIWHAYAQIPSREFAIKAVMATQELQKRPATEINQLLMHHFLSPPTSMAEVAKRYGKAFANVDAQWLEELQSAANEQRPPPASLTNEAAEAIRHVLYSLNGPCEVPDEPIVNIEYFFDSASCDELWKLQNQVDNWILQSPLKPRHAVVLNDRDRPTSPQVFKRGNPANLGEEVPRQFVAVVTGPERKPFSTGSGRLELAQAIVDPRNPLTARVIVNRVWSQHFGAGLVPTPSDFGTRAEPPSHPELLDWLTSRFIADGWSLKKLHRRILTSEAYRQSSRAPLTATSLAKANQIDPENRLLWRMNERRLSFEEMRDSLLSAAGQLSREAGGRAGDLLSPQFTRRSLYGSIDRQFLPSTLRIFDFANPDLHIPQRSDTTVPQQALFFLNHPLVIGYAQALAKRTEGIGSDRERIQQMYRLALQRNATPIEESSAFEWIQQSSADDADDRIASNAQAWQYGFGTLDQSTHHVNFEKLPHFTGSAWQGGAAYPDAKLGWVQLTATGGHPGNDLAHAAIRRWIAPRATKVTVKSTLVHEPKQGEGVRGFVVSSRHGPLAQAAVHHGQTSLSVESLDVQAGDTLDFFADIGNKLSHNQFLWKVTIASADDSTLSFDSERDFAGHDAPRLDRWAQLAQVLLATNEFVFVD
jgi:hypothetical protein